MKTTAYKAFTQNLCSPIQGGLPVWNGVLPHTLPPVELDTSNKTCAAGWNACLDPVDTLKISSFWPDGRPIRLFQVGTEYPVIERGDKLRATSWEITEELDVVPVIQEFSRRYFGDLATELSAEQVAWHSALGRPHRDPVEVEKGLRVALETRGLGDWQLRQYESVEAARVARGARDAWAAWRAAWAAWAARGAWGAWGARAAWGARGAARDAWGAWDAKAALTVYYTVKRGWVDYEPRLLTNGIRWAYRYGLGLAVPTEVGELGWVMEGMNNDE